jgi:hypothetical protein
MFWVLAAWFTHHAFALGTLMKYGFEPARDYLRDHVYGWPADAVVALAEEREEEWRRRNR